MLEKGSLEGVRILDFTWVVAGPLAAAILADQGAEVIRIQNPLAPIIPLGDERWGFDASLNRNKCSITVNMGDPRGLDIAKRLIQVSDIVMENFSSRVMGHWGLDYEGQKKLNPRIIYMSMGGVGHSGRLKDWVTYGPTLQGMCGLNYLTGFPDGDPAGCGYSYPDVAGGYTAALALIMALWHRLRTGEGQYIDLAQLESACSLMGTALLECTANNGSPKRRGNRSPDLPAAPHAAYRCKGDDRWCVIAVFGGPDWKAFCNVIGNPPWTKEERFATLLDRVKNGEELDRFVEAWTQEHEAEEVMKRMVEAGIAAGVVQHGDDIVDRDPQLAYRYWEYLESPEGVRGRYPGIPPKLSDTPGGLRLCGPKLGEHNDYVLGKVLGMPAEEIEQYRKDRVI